MTRVTYGVLTFCGGAVFGGCLTYIFLKPKYEKLLEEKAAEIERQYQPEKKPPEEKPKTRPREQAKQRAILNEKLYQDTLKKTGYTAYVSPIDGAVEVKPDDGSEELELDFDEDKVTLTADEKKPRRVTWSEYDEKHFNLEERPLTYYAGDGVLTDEDDNLIEDVNATVGDALEQWERSDFSKTNLDIPEVIWVVNQRFGTKYEINLSLERYEDVARGE